MTDEMRHPDETELISLGLSHRTMQALHWRGIKTVGDARRLTDDELMRIPNFGKVSLKEVRAVCGTFPLNLTLLDFLSMRDEILRLEEALRKESIRSRLFPHLPRNFLILADRVEGKTYREIGEKYGISDSRAHSICRTFAFRCQQAVKHNRLSAALSARKPSKL